MAEVEKLADRIAILLRGKIAAEGTPRELTTAGTGFTKISVHTENDSLADRNPLPGVRQHGVQDSYQIYHSTDVAATVLAILEHIQTCQDTLVDLRVERPSLEDRFLEITGSQEAVR
jgi:ABC-2 type transport system ATP-binding protein